ncbi:protein b putative-related [Holotrichia oblita]|uniref:Protein b putative-related n=1 Tax=Holotrichia oblita TaxID=644536 RepID=A0ACB9T3M5_HOLOL|nr:protein b putative-related [Holotrichia oblita]
MSTQSSDCKRERLRFLIFYDLSLLKQVAGRNPFEDESVWKEIQVEVERETGKMFSIRAVKDHLYHLLKLFTKDDSVNLRKSGTEEQYSAKIKLLQEIKDLVQECKNKKSSTTATQVSRKIRMVVRDNACHGLKNNIEGIANEISFNKTYEHNYVSSVAQYVDVLENCSSSSNSNQSIMGNNSETTPKSKNKNRGLLKNSALKYLQNKQEKELNLRERQLQLDEKRFELETKRIKLEYEKFELEKKERERTLVIEVTEREQQQNLIKYFININE